MSPSRKVISSRSTTACSTTTSHRYHWENRYKAAAPVANTAKLKQTPACRFADMKIPPTIQGRGDVAIFVGEQSTQEDGKPTRYRTRPHQSSRSLMDERMNECSSLDAACLEKFSPSPITSQTPPKTTQQFKSRCQWGRLICHTRQR